MLDTEAVLYYAEHPVEFTEDVIRARPDRSRQRYSAAWRPTP